jgi:hypothetical protein
LASLVLTVGAVTAVAVVGVVFVLSGRSTSPTASTPPLTSRAAALSAAEHLMAQVRLPAGAVAMASDQSRPRRLGAPPQGQLPSGSVGFHRFFVVRGDPQSVVSAIERLNTKLEANGGSGTAEASAGSGSAAYSLPALDEQSNELAPVGRVRRELQVSAATANGGQSAVRIDARAYWTPPRPPDTLIPSDIRSIAVRVSGADPSAISHGLRTSTKLSAHGDVALVVGFFNGLPIVGKPTPASRSCAGTSIRMNFIGTDGRPKALGVMHPPCGLVDVSIGNAHTVLTIDAPATGFKPTTLYRVLVLLAGVS